MERVFVDIEKVAEELELWVEVGDSVTEAFRLWLAEGEAVLETVLERVLDEVSLFDVVGDPELE